MEELKRIFFSKKFLIFVVLLVLINGIFYHRKQYTATENEKYIGEDFDYTEIKKTTISEYKRLLQVCIDLETGMQGDYLLEYQKELPLEDKRSIAYYQASALLLNQIQYQEKYKEKYQTVKQNSEKMLQSQLFSEKENYAYRNIVKTEKDYKKTDGLPVRLFNNEWLLSWIQMKESNCLILMSVIYVVLEFFSERKNGLWQMIRSMKRGRIELTYTRIGILMLTSIFSVILIYGELWIMAVYTYGQTDLFCNIQSSPQFENCVFPMTILGFMVHICIDKILAIFVVGILLWIFLQVISKTNLAIGVLGIVAVIEYFCYIGISDLSNLKVIKYCNLFASFDTENLYAKYLNLNIFGIPVHIITAMFALVGILALILPVLILILSSKMYAGIRGRFFLKHFAAVKIWLGKSRCHTSLFLHEGYKLLVPLFGILILLLAGFLAWSRLDYSKVYYSGADTYKNIFYKEVRGKPEEEVEVYIEEKQKEIQELLEMGDMGSEKAGYMTEALAEIINQKQYLENLFQTRDIQGDYVNPMGYKMLIGENGTKTAEQNVIVQIFLLSLLFGGYMAYENQNQMISTLHATKRTLISVKLAKLVWILLLTVFLSVLFMEVEIDNVSGRVGLSALYAPAQSLTWLEKFPLRISLRQYIFFVGFLRTIFLLGISFIIFLISQKCKNVRNGILFSVIITVLPVILMIEFL